MSPDTIEIQGVQPAYRPGQPVSGAATWSAGRAPDAVEIRLFWFTSGVAAPQVGLVDKTVIRRPNPCDAARFDFVLPDGPMSFDGALVSLHWAVEAILWPSRQPARAFFVVSPTGQPIALYPQPGEAAEDPAPL